MQWVIHGCTVYWTKQNNYFFWTKLFPPTVDLQESFMQKIFKRLDHLMPSYNKNLLSCPILSPQLSTWMLPDNSSSCLIIQRSHVLEFLVLFLCLSASRSCVLVSKETIQWAIEGRKLEVCVINIGWHLMGSQNVSNDQPLALGST